MEPHPPFTIRPATAADVDTLFDLVRALADYEHLAHAVTGSARQLGEHLFGPRPLAEAILAEIDGRAVGFALYFTTYSTFLTRPGLYLEDIFVRPEHRRLGIGRALIERVMATAAERGCGRMEWSVLEWNTPAIEFYKSLGADVLPDWRIARLTGAALSAKRCSE